MSPDPARVARLFAKLADLNPPLGYPGGPCQVIERIVSDARVKKPELIKKVEDGDDLTNTESSIVYQPIMEDKSRLKGTMFDFIAISPHAQYRMDLRGITVPDLIRAFRNFQDVWAKEKAQQTPRYKDLIRAIQRTEEIAWEFDGMRIVFQIASFPGDRKAAKIISAIQLGHSPPRVKKEDCKPFEDWAEKHLDPRSNFDRLFRSASRSPDRFFLFPLDGGHVVCAKAEVGPGVQTFVKTDERTTDEKKYVALPPGSATPGGAGRDVGKFESNTPDNDIDKRPRSMPEEGESYGHPSNDDYNMPDHRSLYAGHDCESEHSWAWVDPTGKFIEVGDHGSWAIKHLDAQQRAKVEDSPHFKEIWTELGFDYPEAVQAIWDDTWIEPAKGLDKYEVNTLTPVAHEAAQEAGLPTLSKGWWDPRRERLTKEEERFMDSFGQVFGRAKLDLDSKLNQRRKKFWDSELAHVYTRVRSLASRVLLDEGWLMVSNGLAINWHRFPKPVQLESFFEATLRCWKSHGIRPDPDKERFSYTDGHTHKDITLAEALDEFASRGIQESFYGYLLEGRPDRDLFEDRLKARTHEMLVQQDLEEKQRALRKRPPSRQFPEKPPEKRLPFRRRLGGEEEPEEGVEKEAAWHRHWRPGVRQHRQHGQAKRKSHMHYMRNRSKILAKQRIRRARNRHNPAAIASERKRRKQNRHRISAVMFEPCPVCVAERFAKNAPPRERGGPDGQRQRKQKREDARKDVREHREHRFQDNRDSRKYYQRVCKKRPNCMRRREEYRKNPDFYKRRPPKVGSSMLTPDIAFLIGPKQVLGYVDSVSGLSRMVNIRLDTVNASQLMALPVEVFLRAATLLTEEDNEAFFELIEKEIGLDAYDDLDEEGLRECANWWGIDPDSPLFEEACTELTGALPEEMTPEQIEDAVDHVVLSPGNDPIQNLPAEERP